MPNAPGRIAVVDDEPSLLKMMSVYLGRLGYEVVTYASTDRAWQDLGGDSGGALAVAVLDVSMPGLDAGELGRRLLTANARLCVIMTSGYPPDISHLEADAPGRVVFLHKPFTPEMLAEAVRKMLASA
jgi:FixJ family two-component response regulator